MDAGKRITLVGNEFRIFFGYNPALVEAVKTLPERRFTTEGHTKFWAAPAHHDNARMLTTFASSNEFKVEESAAVYLLQLATSVTPPQITAEYSEGSLSALLVRTRFFSAEINQIIKSGGTSTFDGPTKKWRLSFCRAAAGAVQLLIKNYGFTIDPELPAKINDAVAALDRTITLSGQTNTETFIPAPEGLVYRGFQKVGVEYAVEKGNVLIADEPGLGKTIQAIGISNATPEIRNALIICPATPRLNWKREWRKWDMKGLKVAVVSGTTEAEWPEDADVVIISFKLVGSHLKQIHSRTWDMLIVDEAHNLKNPKAKRTQLILGAEETKKLGKVIPAIPAIPTARLVLLTGTPIVNFPIELWPLIHAVNPTRWNNFIKFAIRYCNASKGPYGWDFKGASNLDELQAELRASCMVRRTKAEVLKELPKKTRQIILLENSAIANKERKVLASVEQRLAELEAQKILAYLSNDRSAYLLAASRLKDAAKAKFDEISLLRHKTALAKVPDVVELVKEALEAGKVILFAHHKDVIAKYKEAFGERAVVVTGDTPNNRRDEYVQRFQNDPTCDVFIGSIQAAGVAITLTAAKVVVFGELDWVPGNVTQAEDRAHRIGQLDNVLVWHAIIDGTIEARMVKTLVRKQDVIDAAMDNSFTALAVHVDPNQEISLSESILPDLTLISQDEINSWLTAATHQPTRRNERAAGRISERAKGRGFALAAESITAEEIQAVYSNLVALANVCDGAVEQDSVGFNASDTFVGRTLASLPAISPLQAVYARQMLTKYTRQIGLSAVEAMGRFAQ